MVDVARAEGARNRLANEIGDCSPLLLSQRPKPPVNIIVEIELRPDHAMYVHRLLATVSSRWADTS